MPVRSVFRLSDGDVSHSRNCNAVFVNQGVRVSDRSVTSTALLQPRSSRHRRGWSYRTRAAVPLRAFKCVPLPATGTPSRLLSVGALAVLAPWPAARPTLAFLQLLLGPANAPSSGHFLLRILDPADELVAGQRRDVLPGIECRGVSHQRLAQVGWKLVHHPTGHLRAGHRATVQRVISAETFSGRARGLR